MKRKKLFGLLSLLSIFSLSSCIIMDGGARIYKDLTYRFTEADEKKLRGQMEKFEVAIKDNNFSSVVSSWNFVNNLAYTIATLRTIENINYAKGIDESYDKYVYFSDLVNEILSWEENQYKALAESPYKNQFFDGMSDEEIEALVNSAKPSRYYEIEKENQELLKQYNDLSIDGLENQAEFESKVPDIYKALVKNYNEEATLLGYSDYMEMAYSDIYSREYSVSDVTTFNEYVRDSIVPLYDTMIEKRNNTKVESEYDKETLNNFLARTDKAYLKLMDKMEAYAETQGDAYKSNFKFFKSKGYLVLGNEDANIDAAFTTYLYHKGLEQPIMYLGPNYQDVMTYIHEFGHYNSFAVNGAGKLSYDLAETQSQGNELLFISFLQHKNEDNVAYTYIANNQVVSALQTIIMATIINEFERRVYLSSDIDTIDFASLYEEVGNYFGGYEKIMRSVYGDQYGSQIDYWKRVALSNPGYYISYAMSNIPSLELYSIAKDNYVKAITSYSAIYLPDKKYSQADFIKVIEASGLYSPFSKDAYTLICKLGE